MISQSLLGPHILVPTPAAKLWIDAGCRVVKCVGDFGAAHEVGPEVTVIGRRISFFPDDPNREITGENLRHIDPVEAARFFVDVQTPEYLLNPLIKLWEGVNEPQWTWNNRAQAILDMQWYAAFEAERCRLLNEMGLRAVIGNWSVGIPHIAEDDIAYWMAFLPAMVAAKKFDGALGVHEYSDEAFSVGVNELDEDWDVLRIIKVHRLVLQPNNLGDLDVYVTELGINFRARPNINYAWELMWVDKIFRKHPWIKGLLVFTFGTGRKDWEDFDVNGTPVAGEVAEYIRREASVIDPVPTPTLPAEGIDVSHWQGTIDWSRIAASEKVGFAYIRVSDGLATLDREFTRNWQEAKANRVVRGAYQYFRASKSGKAQAELFLSKIGGKLEFGDMLPAIDVETLDGVSSTQMLNEVGIWIETVRAALGIPKVILYGRKNIFDLWNMKIFRSVADLWIANAQMPNGWTDFKFRQYAITAKDSIPGISATIDRDRFNGTPAEFTNYLSTLTTTPPTPPVSTRFKLGDRIRTMQDLSVRFDPINGVIGERSGFQAEDALGTIVGGPVLAKLSGTDVIWWKVDYDALPDGWSSGGTVGNEKYLEPFVAPVPVGNLIPNGDFKEGFHTPFMDERQDPPRVRDNVRVPLKFWFKFKDDVIEPRLERQDPFAPWLAPEGVFRSADTVSYPFTERLPDDEFTLYLTAESPVAAHYFKLYGIMWWELGCTVELPAGTYQYSIETYEDIYIGNHEFITNEPIAVEWRLNVTGQPEAEWSNGETLPLGKDDRKLFGHWRRLSVNFVHPGGPCDMSFERRSRWGVRNTGTLVRRVRCVPA